MQDQHSLMHSCQSPQALLLAVLRVIHAAHNSVRIRDFLDGHHSSVTKDLSISPKLLGCVVVWVIVRIGFARLIKCVG